MQTHAEFLSRVFVVLVICGVLMPRSAAADELRLNAKALFEQSATRDVRLSDEDGAIELEAGELFEDDGPAAGYSYLANEELLSERVGSRRS